MKTVSIFLGILLSLLLLVSFCYAADGDVAEFQPDHGADTTENGKESQEEKFNFLHHHKPSFKKPFLKPIPPKYPIFKKPIPVFKKPVPTFPIKKPPVYPNYP